LGAVVTAAVLWLPTAAALAALGLLWLAGAWEWSGFARWGGGARAFYVGSFALGMLPAAWALSSASVGLVLAVAFAWWAAALIAVLTYPRAYSRGTVALAGVLTLLPPWYLLAYLHHAEPYGRMLTLTALVVVWAADIGAYGIGRRFGRVKLAPAVSPGKTWEGVVGGMVAAGAVAGLAGVALGLPVGTLVGIGVLTALVSVLGDLTVSLFKRNAGLKDSGTLLPGHGGVMDRVDSLTAAIPAFALALMFAGLVA
jgi:phosphatidate cytidylyltransferase